MCWWAQIGVLLFDYVYFEGGYFDIFCVSRIESKCGVNLTVQITCSKCEGNIKLWK